MKTIVTMSGGKDSTCVALLSIEREVDAVYVFADTGHEHPETYEYLNYLEECLSIKIRRVRADFTEDLVRKARYIRKHWANHGVDQEKIDRALQVMKPTGNPFLDLCILKGRFPSTKARFCTEHLKIIPVHKQVLFPLLKEHGEVETWVGVRADESEARSKLPDREKDDTGTDIVRPILKWSVDDVFAMHRRHHIKPNPLYTQGMNRVGCMPCISCGKEELRQIGMRFPEEVKRVVEWEKIVTEASKQGEATFFTGRANEKKGEGSILQKTEWAKTSRGKMQYDLIHVYEEPGLCHSIYGLCE